MKNLSFLFLLFPVLLSAQDYLVTFSGSGESSTVSTVIVENLTQNKSLTLNGNDVLHLKNTVTEISDLEYNQTGGIQFYPNPMNEFSVMVFAMSEDGVAKIELFDISGRKLTQTENYLNLGKHSYRITGVGYGIYVLKVTTGNYSYSGKLISHKKTGEIINITYQNTIPNNGNIKDTKSAQSEILMQYNTGDALKFNATGGEHKSVKVEVVSQSKRIDFLFYKCVDPDKRNYATVKIGNQIWMAENLAYLPTVQPSSSISYTVPFYYVYGYKGSDVDKAKQQANYNIYGVLYNWPAAKAACPSGWHLPSDEEWTALENYLIAYGYNYDGTTSGNKIAKSLAATVNWNASSNIGAIGNNISLNNKSGFSALPGGSHSIGGPFGTIGNSGGWWSSTEYSSTTASYWGLGYYGAIVYQVDYANWCDFSVRCIKD